MSVILYHSGLSTCSKQARMALREKGVAYESRYLELWRYENLNPEYLKLNPNGVVPTLVHDGRAIYNTLAIRAGHLQHPGHQRVHRRRLRRPAT